MSNNEDEESKLFRWIGDVMGMKTKDQRPSHWFMDCERTPVYVLVLHNYAHIQELMNAYLWVMQIFEWFQLPTAIQP